MQKIFSIKDDFVNSRLDRWFRRNVCEVPQSLIEKNLRKGNIKVNNKKRKSSYKLQKGDQISLYKVNFKGNAHKKKQFEYLPNKTDLYKSSNMFIENNDDFAVLNKPAGVAVQAGTKTKKNIIDILKQTKEFKDSYPYVVHRIDKETTGILIVAKNRKFAQLFTSLFRIRKIHKTYLGIVLGELKNKKGILRDELFDYLGEKKVKSIAITHYNILDTNKKYSLIKLNPVTGRKHQLRKQLLIHGCPILGDSKYRISEYISKKKDRLMLHAFKINFSINDKKYNYSAELPEDFKKMLKQKYLKTF
tara:strand:+ start:734 stop:1645 length:912 start_codon:yes stop_codon:yes gene_type:complete